MINLKNPAELRAAANTFDNKVAAIREKMDLVERAYQRLFENWQDKNSVEIQDVLKQVNTVKADIIAKAETMKTVLNNEASKAEEALSRIAARHNNTETTKVNL